MRSQLFTKGRCLEVQLQRTQIAKHSIKISSTIPLAQKCMAGDHPNRNQKAMPSSSFRAIPAKLANPNYSISTLGVTVVLEYVPRTFASLLVLESKGFLAGDRGSGAGIGARLPSLWIFRCAVTLQRPWIGYYCFFRPAVWAAGPDGLTGGLPQTDATLLEGCEA